jgi:hypothetical protein
VFDFPLFFPNSLESIHARAHRLLEALLGEKSIRASSKRTTLTKSARRDHRRV